MTKKNKFVNGSEENGEKKSFDDSNKEENKSFDSEDDDIKNDEFFTEKRGERNLVKMEKIVNIY